MKCFKRIMAGLASGIMIAGSINVQAQSNINTLPLINPDIMEDSVNDVSDVIQEIKDDISVRQSDLETSYVYEEPSYTQVYYSEESAYDQQSLTLTYDEFMSMFGNPEDSEIQEKTEIVEIPEDTSVEQAAYDQALAKYNAALAEYEAANQMIETTKEIEVEIIEEVTDEEGNVSQITRTEIQTVTEMVPAGDVASAQDKLDAASAVLESTKLNLETAQAQITIVDQPLVEDTSPVPTTVVESEQQAVTVDTSANTILDNTISKVESDTTLSEETIKTDNDSISDELIDDQYRVEEPTYNVDIVNGEITIDDLDLHDRSPFEYIARLGTDENQIYYDLVYEALYGIKNPKTKSNPIELYLSNMDRTKMDELVTEWKLLNFKPSDTIDYVLDQEGYYEAFLISIFKSAIDGMSATTDDYLSKAEKVFDRITRKAGFDTLKSIIDTDKTFQDLDEASQTHLIEQIDEYLKKQFPKAYKDIKEFRVEAGIEKDPSTGSKKIVKQEPTFVDGVKLIKTFLDVFDTVKDGLSNLIFYIELVNASEGYKSVLYKMSDAAAGVDGVLKIAIDKLAVIMSDIRLAVTVSFLDAGADMLIEAGKDMLDEYWNATILASPFAPLLLGQFIGNKISNFLFSTDKLVEGYFKFICLENIQTVLKKTFNNVKDTFLENPSEHNAETFVALGKTVFSFSALTCDVANSYLDAVYSSAMGTVSDCWGSLMNLINDGDTYTYEEKKKDIDSWKNSFRLSRYSFLTNWLFYIDEVYNQMLSDFINDIATVESVEVTKIWFDKDTYEFGLADKYFPLMANVSPSNADDTRVIYTSSNPSVVSINDGYIWPVDVKGVGTAVITATARQNGLTAQVTINVVDGHGADSFTLEDGPASWNSTSSLFEFSFNEEDHTATLTKFKYNGASNTIGIPRITYKNKVGYSVTKIGSEAFSGYSKIKEVLIPDSITVIEEYAFSGCSGLVRITIPASVTIIGHKAFSGCSNLISATVPESVTSSYTYIFFNCEKLKTAGPIGSGCNIEFGYNDTIPHVFYGCNSLTKVILPSDITSIGNFGYCSSLNSIVIPESVITMSLYGTFEECSQLKTAGPIGSGCNIEFGWKETIPTHAFYGHTGLTTIQIPNGITNIGDYAFSSCFNLTKIRLPNSVQKIGKDAFYGCKKLEKAGTVRSESNIELDWSGSAPCELTAFEYLSEVTIPNTVTEILERSFYGLESLQKVIIPSSVTKVGSKAFYLCSQLKTAGPIGSGCNIEIGPMEIIPAQIFNLNDALIQVTIPDGVTKIDDYTFSGCYSLNRVTIPNSVTSIGFRAFCDCTALQSLLIPNGVTNIGKNAFEGCTGLKSVTIPNSVKSIGSRAFIFCTSLTSITLPSSLNTIDERTFWGCTALEKVIIPSSVTEIGFAAFNGCTQLKTAGPMGSGCDVEYGWTESIPDNAFSYMEGLETVTLIDGIKSIGNYAFSECNGLKDIYTNFTESDWNTKPLYTFSDSVTLHFIDPSIFNVNNNEIYLKPGKTDKIIPNDGSKTITWYSSDESVVTVDPNGNIQSKSNGSAYIYAVRDDFYIICVVNVDDIPFKDVPKNAWYYDVAKECYKTGLISGTSATTFSPLQTMTRAMVVTILWRMEGEPKVTFNNKFKDVSSKQWYASSISWAVNNGVVHGYGDGTFKPDAAVTREQVAVMLMNFTQYKNLYEAGTKKLNTYPDGSQVSTWAQSGMKWAISNGIISGNGAGYLNPKKSANRAEGAAMILRMKHFVEIEGKKVVATGQCGRDGSDVTWTYYKNGLLDITGSGEMEYHTYDVEYDWYKYFDDIKKVKVSEGITYVRLGTLPNIKSAGLVGSGCDYEYEWTSSIPDGAFEGCSGLASMRIPESFTSIGKYAFRGCSNLSKIIIHNNKISIGSGAFENCTKLKTAGPIGSGCNIEFSWEDFIPERAFQFTDSLVSIIIPDSVTSLGEWAFAGCVNLSTVTIPKSVTNIGRCTFAGCSKLVTAGPIGSGCNIEFQWEDFIPDYAFDCCPLISITIPDSITSIGWNAFKDCSFLTDITIPSTVTSIGGHAFSGCSALTSIELPDGITKINWGLFSGCSGLTAITIPNAVTSINLSAFEGCTGLTSIVIPDGVTNIGLRAFANCTALASITLPSSITEIYKEGDGYKAFAECPNLKHVYYRGTKEDWESKKLYSFDASVTIHFLN